MTDTILFIKDNFFFFFVLFIILLAIFFLFLFRQKPKKLSGSILQKIQKNLSHIQKNTSPKAIIIDADTLYHQILLGIGYQGTFGEILKQKPKIIKDINKIWKLHKIRNNLVHDFNDFKEKELKNFSQEYIHEIKEVLKIYS